ncbi:MAG: NEL-type E3 ubiquitin ligase domain-containing protein, partial [Gammaproteobacteria bacterium]
NAGARIDKDGRLRVEESIDLKGYTELTALPAHLRVDGDLNLFDFRGLTALPDDLSVSRSLNLSGCKGLAALPNNLSVGGGLNLSNCRSLRALPEHLNVGGGLNLSNCRSLRALPEHLSVGGDLNLSYCVGLTALPNDLSVGVGGTLNLSNCSGLRALPNGLVVGGRFDLYNCRSLMDLPEHLSVGGDLYLSGCAGLTALPDDLSVGGDLYLSGCASLTALPNWFATLGRNENDGDIRQVDLTGTGLSETILNRLRDLGNPNVQFCFGHTAQEYQMFQSVHDALKSWDPEETLQPLDKHSWNLNAGQEVQLMTFLSRLHQTADAKNCNTKPNLQHRVQSFLIQMEKNQDDYRNQALERIAEGLESCDDRVILIMNDIEKLTRIREASCSENPEASLRSAVPM